MKLCIVFTLLVTFSLAANFDIVSSSSCSNVSQGICVKWEQNGTVKEQMGSCFPANSKVMTKNGLTEMSKLKKGDEILGLIDGKQEFSTILSWLHRQQNVETEYIRLNFKKGWLEVSGKHNLATETMDFVFAQQIQTAYLAGQVSHVSKTKANGKYAPRTQSFNYFVYLQENEQQKLLAHSFAHIRNPQLYQSLFGAIESGWEWFEDSSSYDIHPSYTWLQKTFKIVQQ